MVTPIDAVRCGMGFDETGRWHTASVRRARLLREYGEAENVLAPARGAIYGLATGAVLWVGIAALVKMVLRLL